MYLQMGSIMTLGIYLYEHCVIVRDGKSSYFQ